MNEILSVLLPDVTQDEGEEEEDPDSSSSPSSSSSSLSSSSVLLSSHDDGDDSFDAFFPPLPPVSPLSPLRETSSPPPLSPCAAEVDLLPISALSLPCSTSSSSSSLSESSSSPLNSLSALHVKPGVKREHDSDSDNSACGTDRPAPIQCLPARFTAHSAKKPRFSSTCLSPSFLSSYLSTTSLQSVDAHTQAVSVKRERPVPSSSASCSLAFVPVKKQLAVDDGACISVSSSGSNIPSGFESIEDYEGLSFLCVQLHIFIMHLTCLAFVFPSCLLARFFA